VNTYSIKKEYKIKRSMKYITILIGFVLLIFWNKSIAQNSVRENENMSKHLLFIEAGGYGGYGSVNYEYLVAKINKFKFSTRAGFSTYHLNDYTTNFNPDLVFPLGVNVYFGTKHNLDLGLGQTIASIVYADNLTYEPNRTVNFNSNFSIGYRYQKTDGRLMLKVAYAPIIEANKMFTHGALLDFGYAF